MYRAFRLDRRGDVLIGPPFQTGGRDKWTFTLHVPWMESGATATVDVEVSSVDDEDGNWTNVQSWNISEPTSVDNSPLVASVTVAKFAHWIRGRISAQSGENELELQLAAPYFDPANPAHVLLLDQKLQVYEDGLVQLVEAAELDVIQEKLRKDGDGRLMADLKSPDTMDLIRRAIAAQAGHLFRRDQLAKQTRSEEAMRAVRKMDRFDPVVETIVSPLRAKPRGRMHVWRGR